MSYTYYTGLTQNREYTTCIAYYNIKILGHGGEVHTDSIETANHLLQSWYIELPLFLLIVAGAVAIIYLATKRNPLTTAVITALILLVSGFTLYTYSAAISVVSITLGLILSMGIAFISLLEPKK